MALSQTTKLKASLSLLMGDDAAYTNRQVDENITLDQDTEENHVSKYFVDGTVTDQAISLGKVNTPTFIFIEFQSKFNGSGGTTDNQDAAVTIKVDGGTAYQTNYFLAAVADTANDAVTSTLTFSTLANSDTIVTLRVMGRSN